MGAGRLAIRVTAVWTAILGHCGRSFIFLVNFAKNGEVASQDLESSETCNMFNFGYFGVFNAPYMQECTCITLVY